MSIKAELIPVVQPHKPKFPYLRRLKENKNLVVLFNGPKWGVALSGVPPERIGRQEVWATYDESCWEPTSIKLISQD